MLYLPYDKPSSNLTGCLSKSSLVMPKKKRKATCEVTDYLLALGVFSYWKESCKKNLGLDDNKDLSQNKTPEVPN